MHKLNWESLEERRKQARLSMAYKILKGHVILEPILLPKMQFKRPLRGCNQVNVGSTNQLVEPEHRLAITGKTFFYDTPKLWNCSVSPSQANAPSVEAFKGHFKR